MRAVPAAVLHGARLTWVLPLLLCACWFPKDRGQRLEERVDRMEGDTQVKPGDGDRAAGQDQARKLEARLTEMQKQLDALAAAEQRRSTEAPARKEASSGEELARVRAALERQGQRLDALERSLAQREPGDATRARTERVGRTGKSSTAAARPPPAATPGAGAAPAAPAPSSPAAVPADKAGLLAFAREQETRGQKAVARDLYEEYVQKFPDDPSSAEAHFRLGELALGERRYRDAALEYSRVAKEYPRSERAPDALLRTADALMGMKLESDAVAVLQDVPRRYPGSPAAARATQRLAELKAGPGGK